MRDLIGYALYSLVGLVGIVLVFSLFTDAESETQIEQMNGELTAFIAEIRKTHRGHPDLYGTEEIEDPTLIDSGIAPQTTIVDDEIRNAFGGNIEVHGVLTREFAVDYEDVPREVCIQVLTRMKPDARISGFRVADTLAGVRSGTLTDFPVSLEDAADVCDDDENAIRIQAR